MGMAAMKGHLDITLVAILWYEKVESKALVCSSVQNPGGGTQLIWALNL